MKPSYGTSVVLGAVSGLVLALCAMLLVGATGGVPKLDVIGTGSSIEPVFSVPASALWMVIVVTALACGIVLAIATWAVAHTIDPEASGTHVSIVVILGAIVAIAISFAVYPLGVSLLGSLQDGNATASVIDMTILTATVGLAAGASIAWLSYILSRPPQHTDDPELLTA
jgi:hypothetical protein